MNNKLSRAEPMFSFWPPFVDILFMVILFLLFYILVEFFANSEILILIELRKKQELVYKAFRESFKEQFKKKIMYMKPEGDMQRFRFSDRILFDSGQFKLKVEGEQLLGNVFKILQKYHPQFLQIQVVGHTDNVPLKGRSHDNWSLSANRAVAVVRFALKQGFPTDKLSATGYGEYQPIANNETEVGRRLNRRIEVLIVYKRSEKFLPVQGKKPNKATR